MNTNYFFLEFTGPGHHFESDSDIETIDEKNAESNCESLGKYIITYMSYEKLSMVGYLGVMSSGRMWLICWLGPLHGLNQHF